jgi:ABC-type lipoprotein export system ATPase subunit
MSLLALSHVVKRRRDGGREQVVLSDVSLQLGAGEYVAIFGARRSGRTTLLRIAAGLELPDSGSVSLRGRSLSELGSDALGAGGIGYLRKTLRGNEEQGVLEQVGAPLLAHGRSVAYAREMAREALARVRALDTAAARICELSPGESLLVALARATVLEPALIIADEPTGGVGMSERDLVLTAIRALAGDGLAVLATTGEPDELAGAHRALTLGEGTLHGPAEPGLAPVIALRRASL